VVEEAMFSMKSTLARILLQASLSRFELADERNFESLGRRAFQ
jgi:hypothetical protein